MALRVGGDEVFLQLRPIDHLDTILFLFEVRPLDLYPDLIRLRRSEDSRNVIEQAHDVYRG